MSGMAWPSRCCVSLVRWRQCRRARRRRHGLTAMSALGSFVLILALTNGGPAFLETTTLALFAYKSGFERLAVGYGSAVSVIILAVNLVFGVVYFRLLQSRQ